MLEVKKKKEKARYQATSVDIDSLQLKLPSLSLRKAALTEEYNNAMKKKKVKRFCVSCCYTIPAHLHLHNLYVRAPLTRRSPSPHILPAS